MPLHEVSVHHGCLLRRGTSFASGFISFITTLSRERSIPYWAIFVMTVLMRGGVYSGIGLWSSLRGSFVSLSHLSCFETHRHSKYAMRIAGLLAR